MWSRADDAARDPETARAVDAARERMDLLTRSDHSVSPSDTRERTLVQVSAPYGAADLSVVDKTYALLASGVGWVEVSLPPGEYSVRHQLGDESDVQFFTVTEGGGEQKIELPPLPFASPIPLYGTRYFSNGSDLSKLAGAGGNLRLLVWAPTKNATKRSYDNSRSRITLELARLRLEVFKVGDPASRPRVRFPEATWTQSGSALLGLTLDAGCYLLVQTDDDGRQRCMPVWVHQGLLTCVFLLSFESEGKRVPLELDHAAVTFLLIDGQRSNRWIDTLYLLEGVRKALTQGRDVQGWAGQSSKGREYVLENPLLHLMDAILLFSASRAAAKEAPSLYGLEAVKRFDEAFPDAQALLVSMIRLKITDESALPPEFKFAGPPMLRRSWEILLRGPRGNAMLGKVMNFPFTARGNGAWFIWSEEPRVLPVPRSEPTMTQSQGPYPAVLAEAAEVAPKSSGALSALLVAGANFLNNFHLKRRAPPPILEIPPPTPKAKMLAPPVPSVTYDAVVGMLVALTNSGILQKYLDSGRKYAASKGVAIDNEVLSRLVESLTVLKNKTLVKALTAEVLVREALVSLGLPKEKVVQLVRAALTDMVGRLDGSERAIALAAISTVVDAAEKWLGERTEP